VAPDLDKPNEPEPDENAPKEVQDAYVSAYIKSSLNVALLSFKRLTPSTSLMFSELSYENREIVHTAVKTLPAPPLPPATEKELRTMLSNYETWDSKVYSGLRLDPGSIRLTEIFPGSSDEIHVVLSKKPLERDQKRI
jgi:DNA-directed RNA polymerase subunit F